MHQQQESEKQLAESIATTLNSIQSFFHTNKIGQQDGQELLSGFISHVFQGNAQCGASKEDVRDLDLNSPEVQEWCLEIRPLVLVHAKSHSDLIDNLYSPAPSSHQYREILRDAFLDTILGHVDQNEDLTDVTNGLLTCMVACHGRYKNTTFPEINIH